MRQLTEEEIAWLAKIEREMASGERPFVIFGGGRAAFRQKILDQAGVISGQEVSTELYIYLQKLNISDMKAQIAINAAKVG